MSDLRPWFPIDVIFISGWGLRRRTGQGVPMPNRPMMIHNVVIWHYGAVVVRFDLMNCSKSHGIWGLDDTSSGSSFIIHWAVPLEIILFCNGFRAALAEMLIQCKCLWSQGELHKIHRRVKWKWRMNNKSPKFTRRRHWARAFILNLFLI